eukprot:2736353-Amphidinium_carterae.1
MVTQQDFCKTNREIAGMVLLTCFKSGILLFYFCSQTVGLRLPAKCAQVGYLENPVPGNIMLDILALSMLCCLYFDSRMLSFKAPQISSQNDLEYNDTKASQCPQESQTPTSQSLFSRLEVG